MEKACNPPPVADSGVEAWLSFRAMPLHSVRETLEPILTFEFPRHGPSKWGAIRHIPLAFSVCTYFFLSNKNI